MLLYNLVENSLIFNGLPQETVPCERQSKKTGDSFKHSGAKRGGGTVSRELGLDLFVICSYKIPLYSKYIYALGFKPIYNLEDALSKFLLWLQTELSILRFVVFGYFLHFSKKLGEILTPHLLVLPLPSIYRGFWSNFVSSKTIVSQSLIHLLFFFFKSYTLVGYNFNAVFEEDTLAINVGYSHTSYYQFPKGVFVKVLNKRIIQIFGFNPIISNTISFLFSGIKKPSVFTGKGLISNDRPFLVKKRKKQ